MRTRREQRRCAAARPARPPPPADGHCAAAPKVLLHDHLDGGVRPETIIELAAANGYDALPAGRRGGVGASGSATAPTRARCRATSRPSTTRWPSCRRARSSSGSRASAPRTWRPTASSMPRAATRPEQHLRAGLTLEGVVEAVNAGFRDGEDEGRSRRPPDPGDGAADGDAPRGQRRRRSRASRSATATRGCRASTSPAPRPATRPRATSTPSSTSGARTPTSRSMPVRPSGCPRSGRPSSGAAPTGSGHGVRIVDDITIDGAPFAEWLEGAKSNPAALVEVELDRVRLGRLAAYVRDMRIPLEMCPSSNLQTSAALSISLHPITLLKRLRFRVTLNTDNRLMSGTTMSREASLLAEAAGLGPRRPAVGDDQRDEVGLHPLRRASRDHQRRHQAGVCRPGRRRVTAGLRRPLPDRSRRLERRPPCRPDPAATPVVRRPRAAPRRAGPPARSRPAAGGRSGRRGPAPRRRRGARRAAAPARGARGCAAACGARRGLG